MIRQFRHAHTARGFSIDSKDQVVLAVDRGPGWLSLWSENAGIRWRITGAEDLISESVYVETGPASKARVWIGRLGTTVSIHRVLLVLDGVAKVDPSDGAIIAPIDPEERATASARFYPADSNLGPVEGCLPDPALASMQYSPLVGQHTTTLELEIAPEDEVIVGFPPEERFTASVEGAQTLVTEVGVGDPGTKNVVYTSPAQLSTSINVSPLHHLRVTNPHLTTVRARVLWRDFGPIRET